MVKATPSSTVVAPLTVTAPVPVWKVLVPETVVAPFKVTVPVPVWKVPVPVFVMCKNLFAAIVVSPLMLMVDVPVENVAAAPVTSFCAKLPFRVMDAPFPEPVSPTTTLPYKVVVPPLPADEPTLKAVESAIVVAPLRDTVPVPVAKVFEPAIVVAPLRVTWPVEVLKAPELALASKSPADSVSALSTVSVGTVVLGKASLCETDEDVAQ
mmetsp:Transcript_64240/g.150849  ORF Transcript_64240/g.150849 Transcript_64240/m.150849 type:complete len:210 (+) Transcript_64240:854-1483(+)